MLNSDSESRTDSDNEDDINQLDSSGDVSSQSSSDQDVCIKQTFILVKNLKEKALLGIPFLSSVHSSFVA